MKFCLSLACCVVASLPASAGMFVYNFTTLTGIPDDSGGGVVTSITVPDIGIVTSATVTLRIQAKPGESAFLGDLYGTLLHSSQSSVLLNRPGRRAGETAGYDDNRSMTVTFTDAAANDIHTYRLPITGDHGVALTGNLSGNWKPDGRIVDPDQVLDTDSPTALLSNFVGVASQGSWSVFLADLSGGGAHEVTSWTLLLDITPVPESETWMGISGVTLVGWALCRRRSA